MTSPIRERTEAQRARRARKIARRREAGHEPRPVDAGKLKVERGRLARLRARWASQAAAKWKRDHSPETIAAWMRYLGFRPGGAPLAKHRRRKANAASRRASR